MISAAAPGPFSAKTTMETLLGNDAARAVLEKHFPQMQAAILLERRADMPLRQVAQHLPRELTLEAGQPDADAMSAVDADLRRIRAESDRAFSADSVVAVLLADAGGRRVLREHLPELMDSLWLSQAMGFPLTRVNEVLPNAVSAESLRAVDQALRGLAQ
jgi:hypothetical protein